MSELPVPRAVTIRRLETILAHVRQAHHGLVQAKSFKDDLSNLMQYPYTPIPLQKVEPGFQGVNAAIGALVLLIRDLKSDG